MLEQLHTADAVFEGRRILVADDDVRNTFALAAVLEEHGMHVLYAENGREAIEQLEAQTGREAISTLEATTDVAIVLMDIMMPEMDGYQTIQLIRKQPPLRRLPIVALTAKAMKGDREKCMEAGASDYITKPIDAQQLVSLLRVWLYR